MKKIISLPKHLCISVCIIVLSHFSYAQSTVAAAGNSHTTVNGSISYTLGQLVTTYYVSALNSIQAGVQQTYLDSETILEEIPEVHVAVYPNPVIHELRVSIENTNTKEYSYELYSSHGQILDKNSCENNTRISFSDYPSGIYIIRVSTTDGTQQNQYKIIKK